MPCNWLILLVSASYCQGLHQLEAASLQGPSLYSCAFLGPAASCCFHRDFFVVGLHLPMGGRLLRQPCHVDPWGPLSNPHKQDYCRVTGVESSPDSLVCSLSHASSSGAFTRVHPTPSSRTLNLELRCLQFSIAFPQFQRLLIQFRPWRPVIEASKLDAGYMYIWADTGQSNGEENGT